MVEIKFCGMTRPEDAREASSLGAAYVGAILAASPRNVSAADAKRVLRGALVATQRVAVVGAISPADIAASASAAGVDVVQLHGDPTATTISRVRDVWKGQVWAVVRVNGSNLPDSVLTLFDAADAVVLDSRVDGKLGGTGVTLAWNELVPKLKAVRGKRARLVLAGGLSPDNVSEAIATLHPDIVDVSSGVESSVGIKDHERMRAFRDAVRGASR